MDRKTLCIDGSFRTREEGDDYIISGYFAVFNSPYYIYDDLSEIILPGAFDLERDGDIRALTNHDTTLVLGRTTAGTLSLRADDKGLYGEIKVNRMDQDAVNLFERVKRGDVSQCSIGFDIIRETFVDLGEGREQFQIESVKLWEVSVCTFPAYEDTIVSARKKDAADEKERSVKAWAERMKKKIKREG